MPVVQSTRASFSTAKSRRASTASFTEKSNDTVKIFFHFRSASVNRKSEVVQIRMRIQTGYNLHPLRLLCYLLHILSHNAFAPCNKTLIISSFSFSIQAIFLFILCHLSAEKKRLKKKKIMNRTSCIDFLFPYSPPLYLR